MDRTVLPAACPRRIQPLAPKATMFSKSLASATLHPLILSLLLEGPKYGFQLVFRARQLHDGQVPWSNSKLYPILHQMEHKKWIESYWKPSSTGPDRKYYKITPMGERELQSVQSEWRQVHAMWAELWGKEAAIG